VVLAGRTASLLLGGQVPVPVAGENGTVTIEYKDFGVILTARPEYEADGRVFLQITPEVSTLDFTDAIKVSGFLIPALRVRRAQTMVAMRPGETLVLGGLLQRDDVEMVQKIPLLGDLPIIGALFRSRSFQRQESDLMILVTPQIVESPPAPPTPSTPSTPSTPPTP
jgi:pilus assembly protein CpaC